MRWGHPIACGIMWTMGVAAQADEFATAAGYYTTGQWQQAFVGFDRLVRLAPDHPKRSDAEFFRAEAMVQLGDFDLAAERFTEFVTRYPDHSLAPKATFRVGESYFLAGQRTQAIPWLERFVQNNPAHELNEYALPYLALAVAETSNDKAARRGLAEALQRYPRGELAQQIRDRLSASSAPASNKSSALDGAVRQYELARTQYESGEYAKALSTLEQIKLAGLPDALVARIQYALGSSHQQLQQDDQALLALSQAATATTDASFSARIRWKRLRLRTQAGQWDEALRELEEWEPTGTDTIWFYRHAVRHFAESAFVAEKYDLASAAFALLVIHLKDAADIAYGLSGAAWCDLRQENWVTAADLFERLIEQYPDDAQVPAALLAQGYCLEAMNDLDAAIDAYRQIIERFPSDPDRWRADLKAAALLQRQQADGAAMQVIEDGLAATQDDQGRDQLQYQLALLRGQLGQNEAAHEILQSIYDRGPNGQIWADVTYRLAKNAMARGDLATAERLVDEILHSPRRKETDDVGAHALYLKARIAAQRTDWASVLANLDDLQVTRPSSTLVTAARVWSIEALHRLGDHENVRHRIKTLEMSEETLKPAWRRLVRLRDAQALAESGEPEQALARVQPLVNSPPRDNYWAEANLLVGLCEVELGNYTQAHESLRMVLDSTLPLDRETYNAIWCTVGDAYVGQGNYEHALDSYLRVRPHQESPWYAAALLGAARTLEALGRGQESLTMLRRLADSHLDTLHRTQARAMIQTSPNATDEAAEPQLPVSTNTRQ